MRRFIFFILAASAIFINSCKPKPTIIKTEHGHRFINHTNKNGIKPQPGETVFVHTYTYIGDSLYTSTRKTIGGPQEYNLATKDILDKRVPALYDGMLLMAEGDSATVFETIDTFLAKYIPPGLKAAKEVRYEVVMVDVITQADREKAKAEGNLKFQAVQNKAQKIAQEYTSGKLAGQLSATASGLKTLIEDKGSGAAIKQGESIEVHYYGCLTNGHMFDNSFQRGEPYPYPAGVGQMISGFDEGVMLLNHGGKAFLFIPAKLGYGDQAAGEIPPNSELIFYVEVL